MGWGQLTRGERWLCGLYAALAAGALIATWTNNLAFFAQPNNGGLIGFIAAAYANPAAASIANDAAFFCLAIYVFMVVEGRRVGVRHVWVYLVLSGLIAVSVMVPLFLIVRQLALARQRSR